MSDEARAAAPAAVDWRRVVMPSEHGGWAFLGEPLLLGLLVAPSWPGALLALAATAGFLTRQPLRQAAGDRRRGKRYPRTVAAERALALLTIVAAVALAGALLLARGPVLLAVGLAAPLAAVALAADLGQRSRALLSELAGALALAALAAAIPLAAGVARPLAFGLWGVLAIRVVTSVVFVRARLRLDRGEPARIAVATLTQVAGLAAGAALVLARLVAPAVLAVLVVLALRAWWGLSPIRPRTTIARFGVLEIGYGLLLVIVTALAARAFV